MCVPLNLETHKDDQYQKVYQTQNHLINPVNNNSFMEIIIIFNKIDNSLFKLKKSLDKKINTLKNYQNSNKYYFDIFRDIFTTNPITYLNFYDYMVLMIIYLISYSISMLYSYVY